MNGWEGGKEGGFREEGWGRGTPWEHPPHLGPVGTRGRKDEQRDPLPPPAGV